MLRQSPPPTSLAVGYGLVAFIAAEGVVVVIVFGTVLAIEVRRHRALRRLRRGHNERRRS